MNKQFRALFRFQSTINPFIWFMPLVFGVPLLTSHFGSFSRSYHPGFSFILSNQNFFFVGILGSMILAPEKFQFGGTNLATGFYGTEFILTRAVDRSVLYRAKAALLYCLILTMPCLGVLQALQNPDLVVTEVSQRGQQQCLSSLPGSTLLPSEYKGARPSLISIPRGSVQVAEWQLWIFLAAALMVQLLTLILYPFGYAKIIYWVMFFGLVFFPLIDLFDLRRNEPSTTMRAFFLFAGHPIFAWALTAVVFILAQLWCERRFARLEQ